MKYKAFISYSHTYRAELAIAMEAALHRFGIPEHERAGLRLFRDATNLSASPELWPDIQRALDDSEYLILVASPEAAASRWVRKEVAYWREHREAAHMILVLASGRVAWGEGDFDFSTTTALPVTIAKLFSSEPFWIDYSKVPPTQYDVAHPAFCDGIASIAAKLHGRDKAELFGVYVANRISADAERLAVEAELALRDDFPQRSLLLSSAALRLTHERGLPRVPAAEAALRSTLSRFGGRPLGQVRSVGIDAPAAFSADGRWLATIGADGDARVWPLTTDRSQPAPIVLRDKAPLMKLMFTRNPRWLITASEPVEKTDGASTALRLWDAKSKFEKWRDLAAADRSIITCSTMDRDGTHLAADFAGAGVSVWRLPDMDGGEAPEWIGTIPAGGATALVFIKNLRLLVSGARDGFVRIWNIEGSEKDRRTPLAVLPAGAAIEALTMSPEGNVLVARVFGKPPQFWRLDAEEPTSSRTEIDAVDTRIFHVHFSPLGTSLLCRGDASFVLSMKVPDPVRNAWVLNATNGIIWKHDFTGDDTWLATATGLLAFEELAQVTEPEYTVRLWDLLRRKLWRLKGHRDIVSDVAFIPNGRRLISVSYDRTIRSWNCELVRKFREIHLQALRDGDESALADAPGGITEHEAEEVENAFDHPTVLLGADDGIIHCLTSPDGMWLLTVSSGEKDTARLWMIIGDPFPAAPLFFPPKLGPLALFLQHPQKYLFFSELARASGVRTGFSAANSWFFWQKGQKSVQLIDLPSKGKRLVELKTNEAEMAWAGWSPDERWFVATGKTEETGSFEIRLWDLAELDKTTGIAATGTHAFVPPFFSAESRWMLSLQNETALLWDLSRPAPLGEPLQVPGANAAVVTLFEPELRVTFSPCGRWLINAAPGDAVWLHDMRRPDPLAPVATLPVVQTSIETVCADARGRFVFAGGTNDFARLWQISESGEAREFMEVRGHESVERATFSANGRWLVTRDFSAIRLWDLEARECRCAILKQDGDAQVSRSVAFLADDRWAVIAKWRAVVLIDLATPQSAALPITLPGHRFGRIDFWFTPDHRWLVTADLPFDTLRGRGDVPAVQIWDLLAPRPAESAVQLPGLEQGVSRINISSDGQWLSTTSEDGVRLWPLGIPNLLATAEKTVGREFTEEELIRYRINQAGAA